MLHGFPQMVTIVSVGFAPSMGIVIVLVPAKLPVLFEGEPDEARM